MAKKLIPHCLVWSADILTLWGYTGKVILIMFFFVVESSWLLNEVLPGWKLWSFKCWTQVIGPKHVLPCQREDLGLINFTLFSCSRGPYCPLYVSWFGQATSLMCHCVRLVLFSSQLVCLLLYWVKFYIFLGCNVFHVMIFFCIFGETKDQFHLQLLFPYRLTVWSLTAFINSLHCKHHTYS